MTEIIQTDKPAANTGQLRQPGQETASQHAKAIYIKVPLRGGTLLRVCFVYFNFTETDGHFSNQAPGDGAGG